MKLGQQLYPLLSWSEMVSRFFSPFLLHAPLFLSQSTAEKSSVSLFLFIFKPVESFFCRSGAKSFLPISFLKSVESSTIDFFFFSCLVHHSSAPLSLSLVSIYISGVAHDSRVLREVAFNPTSGFPFPPSNKYYLCDAAYTCTRGFMTPYRNTRYWLADFRRRRALTKEEMFNHVHAQLRNVIERAYGVLKARFPILKQMAPYPFQVQKDVVIACFAIHNFIRKCNIQDQLFMEYDENTMFTATEEQPEGINETEVDEMQWSSQDNEYMTNLRNQIANQLLSNVSN